MHLVLLPFLLLPHLPLVLSAPISTTSGTVLGHPSALDASVTAYLGIPYGLAPEGARRWAPPERFTQPATFQIDASQLGANCPGAVLGQRNPDDGTFKAPTERIAEDCLNLNIWVPGTTGGAGSGAADPALKPVLVWIHGGAFGGWPEAEQVMDGSALAAKAGVIVVEVNYRAGVLGFPGVGEKNLGLLDQRAAVEWVKGNIKAFGGDPEKIVLAGQSSGAVLVDMYAYAWLEDPIVKGFIVESGSAASCGVVGNQSATNWGYVNTLLGCESGEIECLRKKSAAELVNATESLSLGGRVSPFVPMPDGKLVFSDYNDRAAKGMFIKVPYIVGSNDAETGSPIASDLAFTCAVAQLAVSRSTAGVKGWRYRFFGGGPVADDDWTMESEAAAAHGAEVPYVFGTLGAKATPQQKAVSEEIQKVWGAFAKNPQSGPAELGWPVFDPAGNTLVRLMYKTETTHSVTKGMEYDEICKTVGCRMSFQISDGTYIT